MSCAIAGTLAVAAAFVPQALAEVEANRNLEVNHSIQMGVLEGWAPGNVLVEAFRGATINPTTHAVNGGTLIASHEARTTAGATYDINHVGGADCWVTNGGGTPDIQPGDLVVATVLTGPGGARTADVDYTFVRDVVFDENADGTVSGHARGVENAGTFNLGAAISPGDPEAGGGVAMEAKRVTTGKFDYLFAPTDIQPDGTFTNVGPIDGGAGLGELFIDTVDGSGGGTGITVANRSSDTAEDTGCGPLETTALTSNSHEFINQANVVRNMVVGGPRVSSVNVTLSLDGVSYPVANNAGAGTWSATIPAADLDDLAEGNHTLRATFSDGAAADEVIVTKDTVAPAAPTATPAPGTYTTTQFVTLSSPGASVRHTNGAGTPNITTTGPIPVSASQTLRAIAVDAVGNESGAPVSFAYVIQPPAQGGGDGGQIVTPPAPAPAPAPLAPLTPTIGSSTPKLSLVSLSTSSRIKRAKARKQGLRLAMRLSQGTEALRIRVYRKKNGTKTLLATGTRAPSATGLYRTALKDAKLRKSLTPGSYEVEVTPGQSASKLGNPARYAFRVVR